MATNGRQAIEEVRELVDDWAKALHAPDIVSFDLAPPLQYAGAAALRESLAAWFPTFRGPVGYEVRGPSIAAGDDIAFCRSLNRISGTRTDGEETSVCVRATVCCRRIDDKWLIVQEHASAPFYMDGSDRAAVDLKP